MKANKILIILMMLLVLSITVSAIIPIGSILEKEVMNNNGGRAYEVGRPTYDGQNNIFILTPISAPSSTRAGLTYDFTLRVENDDPLSSIGSMNVECGVFDVKDEPWLSSLPRKALIEGGITSQYGENCVVGDTNVKTYRITLNQNNFVDIDFSLNVESKTFIEPVLYCSAFEQCGSEGNTYSTSAFIKSIGISPPGPTCTNECVEGQRRCVNGINAYTTCGDYDSDVCNEWSTSSNNYNYCSANNYCSNGACLLKESCTDGIRNQDEEDIDCGGTCEACSQQPTTPTIRCYNCQGSQVFDGVSCPSTHEYTVPPGTSICGDTPRYVCVRSIDTVAENQQKIIELESITNDASGTFLASNSLLNFVCGFTDRINFLNPDECDTALTNTELTSKILQLRQSIAVSTQIKEDAGELYHWDYVSNQQYIDYQNIWYVQDLTKEECLSKKDETIKLINEAITTAEKEGGLGGAYSKNDTHFCVIDSNVEKCYLKKDWLTINELNQIDDFDVEQAKTGLEIYQINTLPVCEVRYGDVQCAGESTCVKAINTPQSSFKDNKKVYDALDIFFKDEFLEDVVNIFFKSKASEEKRVENYGICIIETESEFAAFKSFIANAIGLDEDDPLVLLIIFGGVIMVFVLVSQLTRPRV